MSELRMNHLGALGLLAECSLHLAGPEATDLRESIERCFTDASTLGLIRWKRILSRFDVEPAAAQPEVVVVATDSDAKKELAAQPEEESRG